VEQTCCRAGRTQRLFAAHCGSQSSTGVGSLRQDALHFSRDLSDFFETTDCVFPRFVRVRHNGIIEMSSLLQSLDAVRVEFQSLLQALFDFDQITIVSSLKSHRLIYERECLNSTV
jgi:hypothetical protein